MVVSCSNGDNMSSDKGKMTIFKMDARNKDSQTDVAMEGEMTDGTHSSFVVLMEQEIQVNLLDLTNGITETLVNTDVPVGTYDLVRVYLRGINVVFTDGTTYDLDVPSGEQTGIKVF